MSSNTGTSEIIFHDDVLTVRRLVVSEMSNNIYLLTHRASGQQVLIDAADDAAAIGAMLDEAATQDTTASTSLVAVITTHSHWDHVRALADVVRQYQPTSYASGEDGPDLPVAPDVVLTHGQQLECAGITLEVIALRGHTPGSLALVYRPVDGRDPLIFSGDSLFPGGVGNTGGDQQRFAQLFADVSGRLFDRFDDAAVYPGHGDFTTLAAERPELPQWQQRGW